MHSIRQDVCFALQTFGLLDFVLYKKCHTNSKSNTTVHVSVILYFILFSRTLYKIFINKKELTSQQ